MLNTTRSCLLEGVSAASSRLYMTSTSYITLVYHIPTSLWSAAVNFIVLWLVGKTRGLQSPSNLLLCSLTLNDFLVGVVAQPLAITRTLLRMLADNFCTETQVDIARSFAIHFYRSIALTTLVLISIDRYVAVTRLIGYKLLVTKLRVIKAVTVAWLVNIIQTSVITFLLSGSSKLLTKSVFFAVLAGFVFCIQVAVAVQVYTFKFNASSQIEVERRVISTVVIILAVLFVSYIPMIIVMATESITGNSYMKYSSQWLEAILFMNSMVNPIIFIKRNSLLCDAAKAFANYAFCLKRSQSNSTVRTPVPGNSCPCLSYLGRKQRQVTPLNASFVLPEANATL